MEYLLNKDEMTSCFSEDLCGVVTNAGVGFWVWHVKENKVEYNENFAGIIGHTPETLGVLTWERLRTFVYPEDIERIQHHYEYATTREEGYHEIQYRILNSQNSIMWVREYCAVTEVDENGDLASVSAMVGDITGLRKNMAIMEAQSAHTNDILQTLGIAEWELDIPTNLVTYSNSFEKLVGWSAEELNGSVKLQHDIMYPGELEIYREELRAYLERGEGTFTHRQRLLHKNGQYINVLFIANITQRDDQGKPLKLTGGTINVEHTVFNEGLLSTKLEKTVHANQQLQEQLEENAKNTRIMNNAMFESNPNVSVMFNDKYEVLNCNPKAVTFFHYKTKEDLIAQLVADMPKMIRPNQPDGRKSVSLKARLDIVNQEKYHEFETALYINEVLVPLNIIMQKVPYGNTHVFIVSIIEVKAIQQAKLELAKKERLLRGVNDVAKVLLERDYADYHEILQQALQILGDCVDAESVSLWRNKEKEDHQYYAENLAIWDNSQEVMLIQKQLVYEIHLPVWYEQWKKRDKLMPFFVDSEQIAWDLLELLYDRKSVNNVLIPVTIEGHFWGFVAFSYQYESLLYELKESDILILRSGAMMVASAINKNEINYNLVEAKEKALESMKSKSEFLSRMSHEIRTPMNAIMGMTTLSQKSNDLEEIKKNLKILEFSSRQLLQIINDVLDMSKIDANKMQLEMNEFYLRELLEHVAAVMRVGIEEKQQQLQIEIDQAFSRPIFSDRLRISQVLINLLSNANKFTPNGGEIKIVVSSIPVSAQELQVKFEVLDNGIGISADALPVIFDSFEQGDGSITRKYGGTGLGLSISQKLVRLLGGELTAFNREPSGAGFSFTLPASWGTGKFGADMAVAVGHQSQQNQTADDANQYDFRGKRILVVEDNEINRMLVAEILRETGILIDEVENGAECLQQLRSKPYKYDMIVMDIQMPVMDGLKATAAIRAMEEQWAQEIPVIALTANAFKEDQEACYAAGMNDYIAKPLEITDLMKKIKKYL